MTTHRIATELAGPDSGTGPLLGIWAHPDDEAYLSAALMFRAREAGRRVVVVTATRGEMGTDDPVAWPPDRLAATREREMAASLAAVGVTEHQWLGYREGVLAQVPDRLLPRKRGNAPATGENYRLGRWMRVLIGVEPHGHRELWCAVR